MKQIYPRILTATFLLTMLTSYNISSAQCPEGIIPGGTAFDTTIAFESGVTSTPVKIAKFDPQNGTVKCVKLCITIVGVIDTFAIENLSTSAKNVSFIYSRADQLTGPGLSSPLFNYINTPYGPYNLLPRDGIPNSGPDFFTLAHDTVINQELCFTLTDSVQIDQFYGTDSLTYNYDISVDVTTNTGGSVATYMLTSALVNFHFEYCYCKHSVLPVDVFYFNLNKKDDRIAELKWGKPLNHDEDYFFELEMSPNGKQFFKVADIQKKNIYNDGLYYYPYTYTQNQQSTNYFRVKIVYPNGEYRYSNIKSAVLGTKKSEFYLFPNPSKGIVGIKFDIDKPAKLNIQIFNTNGQRVYNENYDVSGQEYKQIKTLQSGTYFLKLTDIKSQQSEVNQILIIK